jgi:hypothetical protein
MSSAQRNFCATIHTLGRQSLFWQTSQAPIAGSIVVNRLNKIVYRIVDDLIEIADFWDVRREPESLAKQVKQQ